MPTLQQMFPAIGNYKNLQDLYTPYNPKVIPGLDMMSVSDNPSTYAYVHKQLPNTIMLNQNANMKNAPQVIAHEMEHVLQNRVDARKPGGKGYNANVIDAYSNAAGGISRDSAKAKIIASLANSANNKEIPTYFQKQYNYPIKYYGALGDDSYSLDEQWAEISAAEQYLKKDLTKDPFVREKIFNNDPALINTYKGTTGMRMDRWDAKDLPPMTAAPVSNPPAPEQPMSLGDKLYKLFQK